MKFSKQLLLPMVILMLCLASPLQLAAATTNTSLPSSLSMAVGGGKVDAIYNDKLRSEIIISDESYKISPTLAVRSIQGRLLGGLSVLRPGLQIAYKTATQKVKGQSGIYLVEAWLLPAGFKMPEEWQ